LRARPSGKAAALQEHFVLITGCSGGGKSTLLSELQARGHHVVEEPGRRIVQEQVQNGGRALPWIDELAFTHLAVTTALADRAKAKAYTGWVFFDRGLIDAASALERLTRQPALKQLNALHPYHRQVFLAPPWRGIYVTDAQRRHGFDAAVGEYERLQRELPALGYDVFILPKTTVSCRADFVLDTLQS